MAGKQMLRKLAMTSLLMFFRTRTDHQIAAALFMSAAFGLWFALASPFRNPAFNLGQALALATQTTTLFFGLSLTLDG